MVSIVLPFVSGKKMAMNSVPKREPQEKMKIAVCKPHMALMIGTSCKQKLGTMLGKVNYRVHPLDLP